jgi:hypothetical protein
MKSGSAIRQVLHYSPSQKAKSGEVELAVPPQGTLADLHGGWEGDLAADLRKMDTLPGVVALRQLARLSEVTFPSETLYPGYYVEGFDEAWDQVVATWKTHQGRCPGAVDRWHVEAHIAAKRDVLITDDRALQVMCDRLRSEHGLSVHAEGLAAFILRHAHRS